MVEKPGVDLLQGGKRKEVHPFPAGQGDVPVEIAGVVVEILALAKLSRIHEQADHDDVALGPCRAHQAEMAFVERTHRRHEGYLGAVAPCRRKRLAQLCDGAHNSHAGLFRHGCLPFQFSHLEIPDGVTIGPRNITWRLRELHGHAARVCPISSVGAPSILAQWTRLPPGEKSWSACGASLRTARSVRSRVRGRRSSSGTETRMRT